MPVLLREPKILSLAWNSAGLNSGSLKRGENDLSFQYRIVRTELKTVPATTHFLKCLHPLRVHLHCSSIMRPMPTHKRACPRFMDVAVTCSICRYYTNKSVGSAVASWLVQSSPEQAVWVRALAGTLFCVLEQDALFSRRFSPPRCINGYQRTYCWG